MNSLLEWTSLARASDPETSREAATAIVQHLGVLHRWAVECVRQTPGRTQRELGVSHCPDDLRKIGRRLNECEVAGLLRRGMPRACSISGRKAETWYVVGEIQDH